MRASTVFIAALALLVGLTGVAVAKYLRLFDRKEPAAPAPAPAPPKVLVSAMNLYEDVVATADMVMVRDLRPEEEADLKQRFGDRWRDRLVPPMTSAVHMRLSRRNLAADQILLDEYFDKPGLPDRLTKGLDPNTRAVNVAVPKNKAAGGAIRVGEYVDVLLTTKVADGNKEETRTASIARSCKVIMKRNNPWAMLRNDPDDRPLDFTLQANVYRAQLIEYAQTYGQLTLLPVPTPTKPTSTWSDPTSKEYANEDQRIDEVNRGERTIGDEDLVRIFKLNPPPPRAVTPPPYEVEIMQGVQPTGRQRFPIAQPGAPGNSGAVPTNTTPTQPAGGVGAAPAGNGDAQPANFTFRLPSATGDTGCKTCGKKNETPAPVVRPN